MRRFAVILTGALVFTVGISLAQQAPSGPYKVLKTARVGGEGNWDYIYADSAGRRLYIPRRGTGPEASPVIPTRLSIFNLDTLAPIGEIEDIGGNRKGGGPQTGPGFPNTRPGPT